MQRNSTVVAEYDYYTLDQARKIISAENRQKRRRILEGYFSAALMILIPLLFVIDWLICGY